MEKQEKNSYRKTEFVNIIQLFLLGYYNLYVLDMVICQNDSHYPILMIIGVCCSYWARENIDKLGWYFLTRFGVILYGVIIGRNDKEKILFAFAGVVISLVSWYRRIHINHTIHIENIGLLWLVLLLPGYLFMGIYGQEDTTNVLLGVSVLFIWLYYLNKYQANREKYLVNNKKTVGIMQDKEIKSNSNKGMLFFLGCSLITLFWESGIYFRQLEREIANAVFGFFKWLLEILTNVKEEEYVPQEIVQTLIPQIEGEGYGEVIHGSEWMRQFFQALEHILWGVVEVLWVAFIIFVLCSTAYGIWYVFYHKGKRTESRTLQQEDIIIQRVKKEPKRKKKGREFFIFRNPNQKIRQMFYLEIKDYQKEKCNKECMTATELANQVYDERKEVTQSLLPYYQRARYSKKGVTQEEAGKCGKYRKSAKRILFNHRSDV
ncbi:MAG: hypothetical protein K2N51_07825 [Lachnospiraceae bacterium]|nr:hypothetical protein [Lachnospiraceae bacterium]